MCLNYCSFVIIIVLLFFSMFNERYSGHPLMVVVWPIVIGFSVVINGSKLGVIIDVVYVNLIGVLVVGLILMYVLGAFLGSVIALYVFFVS